MTREHVIYIFATEDSVSDPLLVAKRWSLRFSQEQVISWTGVRLLASQEDCPPRFLTHTGHFECDISSCLLRNAKSK
jgi:hypothetical protein